MLGFSICFARRIPPSLPFDADSSLRFQVHLICIHPHQTVRLGYAVMSEIIESVLLHMRSFEHMIQVVPNWLKLLSHRNKDRVRTRTHTHHLGVVIKGYEIIIIGYHFVLKENAGYARLKQKRISNRAGSHRVWA